MPIQESLLEDWLKKRKGPVALRRPKPPVGHHKVENPKWNDDTWFEKRYGDPEYYSRVRGLS
jgi:hypothetical protein